MRQKLFEAYTFDYSPPPTPGYLNEALNDIEAKVGQNGIVMTNISDITNMKNSTSTTNMNKVGSLSFNSGMKMANNAITGVDTITGVNTITGSSSGTTISNVDQLSFTNTSSYISPSVALANSDENVIGYTIAKYGASKTGGNNWSIQVAKGKGEKNPPYPTQKSKAPYGETLVSLSLPTGVWLINYGILLEGMGQANNTAVVRVIVGTDTNNIIFNKH